MREVTITTDWLSSRGLCSTRYETEFGAEWGESVALTRAVLLRAAEMDFDTFWLSQQVLSAEELPPVQPAYEDVQAARRARRVSRRGRSPTPCGFSARPERPGGLRAARPSSRRTRRSGRRSGPTSPSGSGAG